jgi:hypothetical protein
VIRFKREQRMEHIDLARVSAWLAGPDRRAREGLSSMCHRGAAGAATGETDPRIFTVGHWAFFASSRLLNHELRD